MKYYEQYLEPEIRGILNFSSDKKSEFEKCLGEQIKKCQNNFANTELWEFISNINAEIEDEYPSLGKRFVTRTEEHINVDGTFVFTFTKDKSVTENFIEFIKKKSEITNQIKSIANQKVNNISTFSDFLNNEVYPYIKNHPDIINNPFYKEINHFEFTAKYVEERMRSNHYLLHKQIEHPKMLKLMVTFSYNGISQNPFEVYFQSGMEQYRKDNLKMNLFSQFQKVLSKMESKKLEELEKIIPYRFHTKVKTGKMLKWSEAKPYYFNTYLKTFYISVLFKPEHIEELFEKTKNLAKILNTFKEIPEVFKRDFRLRDEKSTVETYSFETRELNINWNADSEEFKIFAENLKKKIQGIIQFEEFNIMPTEDFTSLYRYNIKKIDNYDIGTDRYVVYRFRGKKNRTYVRGFKNGRLMSTFQLAKSHNKRKEQFTSNS